MLTRLEISGFKNLRDLDVDFGPFTCIAGERTALENRTSSTPSSSSACSLHALSCKPLRKYGRLETTVLQIPRTSSGRESPHPGHLMHFAAEMILPQEVEDDFGRKAQASITFVRYEIDIGYEPPSGYEKIGRLVLARESLTPIKLGDAPKRLRFPCSVVKFRKAVVTGRRAGGPLHIDHGTERRPDHNHPSGRRQSGPAQARLRNQGAPPP